MNRVVCGHISSEASNEVRVAPSVMRPEGMVRYGSLMASMSRSYQSLIGHRRKVGEEVKKNES